MLIGSAIVTFHDLAISTLGILTASKSLACRKSALMFSPTFCGSALKVDVGFLVLGNVVGGLSPTFSPFTSDKAANTADWLFGVPSPSLLCLSILPIDMLVRLFRGHSRYVRVVQNSGPVIATCVGVGPTIEVKVDCGINFTVLLFCSGLC